MSVLTDYEWLTEMNLCHKCRKNKAAPNRKYCFDCLEKIREENMKRYDSEKAKEYQARRREIYRQKKENGICVRCNKKATHGMYCFECSIKVKRHNAKTAELRRINRHERGLIPEMRVKNGLCIRCGGGLSDREKEKKIIMCQSCRGKVSEQSKQIKNHPWRDMERKRYEKNRRLRHEHLHSAIQEAD